MFNQQQQFHQLMQLQQLLQQQQQQQQQQQHPVQHQAPRSMPAPVQHQQPQQMLNLTAANPSRLLNTHPVLQRALLMQQMQGNLRGLGMGGMGAPPMPHFFSAAARQSILGTPPLGVTVKAPRMGFPALPFQQHHRMFQKDHYRSYDRKRDAAQASSIQTRGDKQHADRAEAEHPPPASEADENVSSSEDSENLTECSIINPLEPSAKKARSSSVTDVEEAAFPSGGTIEEGDVKQERSVESQSTEGVGGGRALKVTIQQRSESRTISNTMLIPKCTSSASSSRFCCYICKSKFHCLQAFQSHLVTARHHQKLKEIQKLSNACLVTLMPTAKDGEGAAAPVDGKKPLRWCNVCQIHFSSDLLKHLRTQEHKLAKRSLRPFCTVCSRHFKTPRKFVEHMKSPEHKQKTQEVRLREKEPWTLEESEDLITVDAVGCFEEEEEEDDEEEEEGISEDDASADTECAPSQGEMATFTQQEGWEEYSADTVYGEDFIVPVAGFLCRLCHKFYSSDSAARLSHCKSLTHYQNVQNYNAAQSHPATLAESGLLTKTEIQGDEGSVPISEHTQSGDLEEIDEGAAALQGDQDQGCLKADRLADEEKGNLIPGQESEDNLVASAKSNAVLDSLVGTHEEDAGYRQDTETLPLAKEMESNSEAGISLLPDENSSTHNDSTAFTNRRSSRHK